LSAFKSLPSSDFVSAECFVSLKVDEVKGVEDEGGVVFEVVPSREEEELVLFSEVVAIGRSFDARDVTAVEVDCDEEEEEEEDVVIGVVCTGVSSFVAVIFSESLGVVSESFFFKSE
jgi:hypothetical protein